MVYVKLLKFDKYASDHFLSLSVFFCLPICLALSSFLSLFVSLYVCLFLSAFLFFSCFFISTLHCKGGSVSCHGSQVISSSSEEEINQLDSDSGESEGISTHSCISSHLFPVNDYTIIISNVFFWFELKPDAYKRFVSSPYTQFFRLILSYLFPTSLPISSLPSSCCLLYANNLSLSPLPTF